jgi:hypothetical protein
MRDSIEIYSNKKYNIHYYNEQYIEQFDINQQYNHQQYNETSSIFSLNDDVHKEEERLNRVKYTELYELYEDNVEESLDNYEENKSILELPLSHDKYLLMKREWNKQLDTLSFSTVKKNNNYSKKSFKSLINKFLNKNKKNKTKNVSFYRVLIN